MKTVTYKLPSYWASYLINNDYSGLEDSEKEQCDAVLDKITKKYGFAACLDCTTEPENTSWHDAGNNLFTECFDYTFVID